MIISQFSRSDTPFCIDNVDFMTVNRHLEKYYLNGWHEKLYRKGGKFEDQDGYQCSIYDYVVKHQALGLMHAYVYVTHTVTFEVNNQRKIHYIFVA